MFHGTCYSWCDCNIFLDPCHKIFFHRNSNSMEISLCSHRCCSEVIAMKLYCAAMICKKVCSELMPYNGVTFKSIFHRILITLTKSFMKWATVSLDITCSTVMTEALISVGAERNTPYITLTAAVWVVFWEDVEKQCLHDNGTTLYMLDCFIESD